MLPLKLVRSLVLREPMNSRLLLNPNNQGSDDDGGADLTDDRNLHSRQKKESRRRKKGKSKEKPTRTKTPFLLFLPTKELVSDTYRLATLARDMGMDLYPSASLSHIIFSYSSAHPSPSSSTSTSSSSPFPLSWSSSSSFWSLPDEAVPLPFPSLTSASLSHLRYFVSLSKGLFKLVFVGSDYAPSEPGFEGESNWNCCSISLHSQLTGDPVKTMDDFCRILAGKGWTLFKTMQNSFTNSGEGRISGGKSAFLFRKTDSNRVRAGSQGGGNGGSTGECRIRELRLPELDFGNAPLRILQYILLMTDDIFYLA